ncbi:molybdenum cofactor cytidylyltransferase [Pseudomonas flavescens]|uniref:Molybdenum cofactor cytidylyltransferase n=1 Tax=Phytopseudomonas flavescens TaxID=29435 RepID=A0A1G8D0N6_9GAMM|nr:nucleotidyltransferase family protein [Pseudomonas flavescens]SDH50929.1 molybdenum cofactor cytidylyltransferase [Pseudomonas flavescens]
MPANAPVVIVLAAGRGSRFRASGGVVNKLQADLNGKPVLEHVLAAVERAGLDVHVVRSARGDGMGDSIAEGVRATAGAAGWLVLPGDLPLVQAHSLCRVAHALASHAVVVPVFGGNRGHPVGFARACFEELAALSGEAGAASVVQRYRARGSALQLSVEDAGILIDIDTCDDLQRLRRLLDPASVPASPGQRQ